MWSPILKVTTLAILSNGQHIAKNNTDVIVTYSGHAEANDEPKFVPKPTTTTTEKVVVQEYYATETTKFYEDETEGVVFVPNDKPDVRNYDYHDDRVRIDDLVSKRRIGDLINDKNVRVASESPNEEILFISGKNNELAEVTIQKEREIEQKKIAKEKKKKAKLNCKHLECTNTLKPVCGGKVEHKQWRYRLFMNDCYFRKVNCAFKYEENRFIDMPVDMCKHIGGHHREKPERPFVLNAPQPILPRETPAPPVERRISSASRRSLNIEVDGTFCSHDCPTSCPEDYSPECAVTTKGQRKVFVNHCKLDYNSCSYGTVWHKRPLSDCVGNKKADLQQNRAFIGWMQRVGIVDNKGRLVMA
ncbi:hypothetical protein ABMA28_012513 [Loxostege sticticalis]|uniref:Kazal-like domain-containing protein n=1 Tax=Loxostege sticticalis TaxID=481309 RepID=A0ABD0S535_LOXSC